MKAYVLKRSEAKSKKAWVYFLQQNSDLGQIIVLVPLHPVSNPQPSPPHTTCNA